MFVRKVRLTFPPKCDQGLKSHYIRLTLSTIAFVKLSECRRGDRGHLIAVEVQPCYQLRVQELGLRPGAQFVVTNRAAFGGVVLNVGGARVAVDVRSSKLIEVEVTR